MEPTKELVDSLYLDKVDTARSMTPEQKIMLGADLFDRVCTLMRAGVRSQFPGASDVEVERILRDRLLIARRLENR